MREELQKRDGMRGTFTATFVRFSRKTGYGGHIQRTVLFRDIRDSAGRLVTDHLWFKVGKWTEKLELQPNDHITFEARVKPYKKGYRGYREDEDLPRISLDYHLAFPTNVRKVHGEPPPMPLFAGLGSTGGLP